MGAFAGVDAMDVLRQAMKVSEQNHRIIANNLANGDTPGYNAVQLDFQRTLRNAVESQRKASLRNPEAHRFDESFVSPYFKPLASISKNDYNKVDIDAELARLSENTSNYNVFGSLLAKRFATIKTMLSTIR